MSHNRHNQTDLNLEAVTIRRAGPADEAVLRRLGDLDPLRRILR